MTSKTFSALLLPCRMAPSLALSLSLAITGHEKETGLVRYVALALLSTSWRLDDAAGLDAFMLALHEIPAEDSGALLDTLSRPSLYTRNAVGATATKAMLRELHSIAMDWKMSLSRPGLNVLRLHTRALSMLDHLASAECASPRSIDQDIALDAVARVLREHGSSVATAIKRSTDVQEFQSAVAALDWMLTKVGARPSAPSPAGDEPLAHKTTDASELGAMGYQIFDPLTARNSLKRPMAMAAGGEGNSQQKVLLESMAQNTGYRGMSEVPDGGPLDGLYARFPHFKEVLDFVASSLALAACGEEGCSVRFSPILLRGTPGTGKTYFAQELARVLGTAFLERDLSVTSEAFVLSGLDAGWKNSKPGLVFDALVSGTKANPLICLNEVDKVRAEAGHSSPLASLYTLLEPASARLFTDEFVPVPIDASRINWVLTANDGTIPDPILSRLEQFTIAPPTAEQCRAIAQSVWDEVQQKHMPRGHGFPVGLPSDVLDFMSKTSPRVMRKALTHTAGLAAKAGRKELCVLDLEQGFHRYQEPSKSRPIGFMASH